jgi:GH24 family phage-related lysozyme (muramidase)
MCSRFGKNNLLVTALSYNVGYYRLVGYGKMPKSRLIQKLESGNRNIYEEYISFRYYKEKVVPGIERQRKKEFELLYIP